MMYVSLLNQPGSLFGQLELLRREFDEAFGASGLPSSIRSVTPGTHPAINVGRTPSSVEVYVFAPGLDASKVEVTLDRGVLRIAGACEAGIAQKDAAVQIYAHERVAGSFTRAVSLPDDVDPSRVTANYRDGVLQISIARRESAQPQRITVQ
jgi:HSP20 family protein